MNRLNIRLACHLCDRTDFDGIDVLPDDWDDIQEIQSLADSLRIIPVDDTKNSPLEWYTHLGTCPDCRKEDH
ncbi:MAG: hypothetical protein R3C28_11170 [Pirellulaceae bacterium]